MACKHEHKRDGGSELVLGRPVSTNPVMDLKALPVHAMPQVDDLLILVLGGRRIE